MNGVLVGMLGWLAVSLPGWAAERAEWDQERAKEMVRKVLEVEGKKSQPWDRIPWRSSVESAVKEAGKSSQAIFVYFYSEDGGSPAKRPCLEGRLLRTHALADSTVLSLVKSKYIPVKVKLEAGKEFPLDWPALKRWATAYRFSSGEGLAGCSVVSSDLEIEFANTGSAKLWQLFDSRAYDAKRFAEMLEQAASRVWEERTIRVKRRDVSEFERKLELHQFRRGVTQAVRSEINSALPPGGYSLEKALELRRMAGEGQERAPAK